MPSQKFDVIDGLNITGDLVSSQSLVINTSVLVANSSTSRVGIGTASPSTLLDVRGVLTANTINANNYSSNNMSLTNLSTTTETTALVISSANVVSKRALGSLAFQSSFPADELQLITDISATTSTSYSVQLAAAAGAVQGYIDSAGLTFNTGTNILTVANVVSAANLYSTGDAWVANRLHHVGDTDTYLEFDADNSFRLWLGGAQRAKWTTTAATCNVAFTGTTIQSSRYFIETVYAAGAGTAYTIDVNNGSVHTFTPTGDYSIDFTNLPASGAASFILIVDGSAAPTVPYEATWPGSAEDDKILWAEGIEPPSSIGIDIYSFVCVNGQLYGSLSIRDAGWAE